VLHNSLAHCDGKIYLFLDPPGGLQLCEVQLSPGALSLQPVATLGRPEEAAARAGGALTPPLSHTCCAVDTSPGGPAMLALSSGSGDLTMLRQAADGSWQASNTITLLPAGPPLLGVKPFMLRAAMEPSPGRLQLVLVTIFDKTDAVEAGCEVCSLSITVSPGLEIACAAEPQRLYVSGTPPHAVLARGDAGAGGAVLLAVTPGHSLQLHPGATAGHSAAPEEGHRGLGLSDSAAGSSGVDGAAINDGDGDDVDDALLAAAQARLAHMTSERQEGAGADLQAADVFKEGGPDGLGEMGAEPACDLLLLELGGPAPRTLAHMPLAPHRVVTAHAGVPRPAGGSAVLGVTDDVDCALLELSIEAGTGGEPRMQVAHAANVPALAYVAAGKQQKKFLLLDTPPTGPVSAALVETLKYAYIYSRTAPSEAHGVQQVVDLEQSGSETALLGTVEGAQLVSGDGRQALLLLSQGELLALFFS